MDHKQYNDLQLIRGCRKNKRHFQELLYRKFFAFGMSVCLRYTTNREDALEVLHDGFIKVYNNLHVYDDAMPFKSWFRKILVNTALDQYRRDRKYKLNIQLDLPEENATEPYQQDLPALGADEILELFRQLPDMFRMTYNLYEVEGYKHDEIAGMLDISPGTSRSNLSRAKKMLRQLYIESERKAGNEAI